MTRETRYVKFELFRFDKLYAQTVIKKTADIRLIRRLKTSFRPSEKLKIIFCHLGRDVIAFQLAFYRRYTDIPWRDTNNAKRVLAVEIISLEIRIRNVVWICGIRLHNVRTSTIPRPDNTITILSITTRCGLFVSVPYNPGPRKISD